MTMSDPIADMLTRIRNANTAKHDTVDVPYSKMKLAIADILVKTKTRKSSPASREFPNRVCVSTQTRKICRRYWAV